MSKKAAPVKVPEMPLYSMGEMVRLTDSDKYLGPVKGDPVYVIAGEWIYHVAHGMGGRKLFRESELKVW